MADVRVRPADAQPVLVVGARPHPLRDVYHGLLRASWPVAISVMGIVYVALNLVFAVAYHVVGGIANADTSSFADAFFFSVQTLATIGYGDMHPASSAAHVLVTVEAFVGIAVTAIFTGLVFAKFATANARIVFSRNVVIHRRDGQPVLMLRIGNDRNDSVLDAHVHMIMTRTTRTAEGEVFYRMVDLQLVRNTAPVLARSFVIMHEIDEHSPLRDLTADDYAAQEIELMVSVSGLDETTKGPVHAVYTYEDRQILHDHRFVDVLSEREDGRLIIDVRRFHDVVPV